MFNPAQAQTSTTPALQNVSVFSELKFSSDREDNNLSFSGREKLASYRLLNVGANWQINPQWALLVRVNNLTNTNYSLANTFSAPGRNIDGNFGPRRRAVGRIGH